MLRCQSHIVSNLSKLNRGYGKTVGLFSTKVDSFLSSDYKPIGQVQKTHENVEYYQVGKLPENKDTVLIISDLYGWNSGRVRSIADYFGANGCRAIIPNLSSVVYHGDGPAPMLNDSANFGEFVKNATFHKNLKPNIASIINTITQDHENKVGLVGISWGGWVVANILASDLAEHCSCGVLVQPNINLESYMFGQSMADLFGRINKPMLLLAAKGDAEEYGAYIEMLKGRLPTSDVIDYHNLDRDFLLRGNINADDIRHGCEQSLGEMLSYLKYHSQTPSSEIVKDSSTLSSRRLGESNYDKQYPWDELHRHDLEYDQSSLLRRAEDSIKATTKTLHDAVEHLEDIHRHLQDSRTHHPAANQSGVHYHRTRNYSVAAFVQNKTPDSQQPIDPYPFENDIAGGVKDDLSRMKDAIDTSYDKSVPERIRQTKEVVHEVEKLFEDAINPNILGYVNRDNETLIGKKPKSITGTMDFNTRNYSTSRALLSHHKDGTNNQVTRPVAQNDKTESRGEMSGIPDYGSLKEGSDGSIDNRKSGECGTSEMKSKVENMAEIAKNTAAPYAQHARDVIEENMQHLVDDAKEMTNNGPLGGTISKARETAEGKINQPPESVLPTRKTVNDVSMGAVDETMESAKSGAGQLKDVVSNKSQEVKQQAEEWTEQAKDTVGKNVHHAKEVAEDKVQHAKEAAKDKATDIGQSVAEKSKQYAEQTKEKVHEGYEHAKEKASELGENAKEVGEHYAQEAKEHLKEDAKIVQEKVKSFAEKAAEQTKSTVQGYVGYAKDKMAEVGHELKDAAGRDVKRAQDAIHEFAQHPEHSINETVQYVQEGAHKLKETMEEVVKQVRGNVHDASQQSSSTMQKANEKVKGTTENISKETAAISEEIGRKLHANVPMNDIVHNVAGGLKKVFNQQDDAVQPDDKNPPTNKDDSAIFSDNPRAYTQQVKSSIEESGKEAMDATVNYSEKLQEKADALNQPVKDAIHKGQDTLKQGYEKVKEGVQHTGEKVGDSLREFGDNLSQNIQPPGHSNSKEDKKDN